MEKLRTLLDIVVDSSGLPAVLTMRAPSKNSSVVSKWTPECAKDLEEVHGIDIIKFFKAQALNVIESIEPNTHAELNLWCTRTSINEFSFETKVTLTSF